MGNSGMKEDADELWMYRYIVGMNCRYCNDNVLGVYGSIVGNERVSVRKQMNYECIDILLEWIIAIVMIMSLVCMDLLLEMNEWV